MKTMEALKKRAAEAGGILTGTALTAMAYYLFMKPSEIVAPGLGGVAVLIAHFLPLSLGTVYFLLNIPLFILGFRYVGGRFVAYSLLGMACLSAFLTLFDAIPGIRQPLVGAVLGGALSGASIAMVLMAGGSTGGLDIACVVANKLWPSWTVGRVMFWLNALIILVSGVLYGLSQSVLTLLSIYLAGKSLDLCLAVGNRWINGWNSQMIRQGDLPSDM